MAVSKVKFTLRFQCSSKLAAFPWSYVTAKLDEGSGGEETFFFLDSVKTGGGWGAQKPPSPPKTGLILEHRFSLNILNSNTEEPPSFLYLHLFGAWTDPGSNMLVCKTIQTTRLALVEGGQVQADVNLSGRQGLLQVSHGLWGWSSERRPPTLCPALPECTPMTRKIDATLETHLRRVQDFFYRGQNGALPWRTKTDAGNNVSNEVTPLGAEVPGDLYLYLLSKQALEVALKHLETKRAVRTQELYWTYSFQQACLRLGCGPAFLKKIREGLPSDYSNFERVLQAEGTRLDSVRLCMELFVNMICFPCVVHNYSADLCPDLGANSSQKKQTPSFFSATSSSLQQLKRRRARAGAGAGRAHDGHGEVILSVPCEKFEPMTPGLGRTDDCESLSMRTLINYTHFMAWTRACDLQALFLKEPLLACCIVVLHKHYQLLWLQVIIDPDANETNAGKELPLGPQPDTGPLEAPSLAELSNLQYVPTQQEIQANVSHVTLGLAPKKRVLEGHSAGSGGDKSDGANGQRFYLLESTAQFLGDNFWDDPQGGTGGLSRELRKFYARFTDARLLRIDAEIRRALRRSSGVVRVGNSHQWAQTMYLRVCNFLTFPYTEGVGVSSREEDLRFMRWQVPCRLGADGEKLQSGVSFGQFVAWASAPAPGSSSRVFVGTQDAVQYSARILDTTLLEWEKARPPLGKPLTLPLEKIRRGLHTLEEERVRIERLEHARGQGIEVVPVSAINYLTCQTRLRKLGQKNEHFSEIPYCWPLMPARRDDGWYRRQSETADCAFYSIHYLLIHPEIKM